MSNTFRSAQYRRARGGKDTSNLWAFTARRRSFAAALHSPQHLVARPGAGHHRGDCRWRGGRRAGIQTLRRVDPRAVDCTTAWESRKTRNPTGSGRARQQLPSLIKMIRLRFATSDPRMNWNISVRSELNEPNLMRLDRTDSPKESQENQNCQKLGRRRLDGLLLDRFVTMALPM